MFFLPLIKYDHLIKITTKMSYTYYFESDIMMNEDWKVPNFDYVKEKPKDVKKTWISVEDDDDDNDDIEDEDSLSVDDDKCIHITIEDSEEEEPKEEKSRSLKRKFEAITPNYGCFNDFPDEIIDIIISFLLERKHSDGKSAKKSFFPLWMAQFHTFKTFRNLSRSFRSKINHYYNTKILKSMRYFQKYTPIFEPVLKKIWNKTTKNIILQEVNDWLFHNNKSQQEKENHEYIWIMFKALVYLSSDFPTIKITKRKGLSGENGLWVYYKTPLGKTYDHQNHPTNMIQDFYPISKFVKNMISKCGTHESTYLATFGPSNHWKILQDEEEAFFKAGKSKLLLSGDVKNKDEMINDIYNDLLNVKKINVF